MLFFGYTFLESWTVKYRPVNVDMIEVKVYKRTQQIIVRKNVMCRFRLKCNGFPLQPIMSVDHIVNNEMYVPE